MRNLQRISPLAIATCAVIGGGFGLLVQLYRSTRGQAPLVPSLSLTFTLLVFGAVVLGVGVRRNAALLLTLAPIVICRRHSTQHFGDNATADQSRTGAEHEQHRHPGRCLRHDAAREQLQREPTPETTDEGSGELRGSCAGEQPHRVKGVYRFARFACHGPSK